MRKRVGIDAESEVKALIQLRAKYPDSEIKFISSYDLKQTSTRYWFDVLLH